MRNTYWLPSGLFTLGLLLLRLGELSRSRRLSMIGGSVVLTSIRWLYRGPRTTSTDLRSISMHPLLSSRLLVSSGNPGGESGVDRSAMRFTSRCAR